MSLSRTLQTLVGRLSEYFGIPEANIDPEATFVQIGLDSLSLVEFAMMVTEEYGVDLDDLAPDNTLAEAAVLIDSQLRTSAETSR